MNGRRPSAYTLLCEVREKYFRELFLSGSLFFSTCFRCRRKNVGFGNSLGGLAGRCWLLFESCEPVIMTRVQMKTCNDPVSSSKFRPLIYLNCYLAGPGRTKQNPHPKRNRVSARRGGAMKRFRMGKGYHFRLDFSSLMYSSRASCTSDRVGSLGV